MTCVRGIKGEISCSTREEAMRPDAERGAVGSRGFFDWVGDRVIEPTRQGAVGVGKAAWKVVEFPTHVVQYVTGTSREFGVYRPWSEFGAHYGSWWNVPLRLMDTVNRTAGGLVDGLSFGTVGEGMCRVGLAKVADVTYQGQIARNPEEWGERLVYGGLAYAGVRPVAPKALPEVATRPVRPVAAPAATAPSRLSDVIGASLRGQRMAPVLSVYDVALVAVDTVCGMLKRDGEPAAPAMTLSQPIPPHDAISAERTVSTPGLPPPAAAERAVTSAEMHGGVPVAVPVPSMTVRQTRFAREAAGVDLQPLTDPEALAIALRRNGGEMKFVAVRPGGKGPTEIHVFGSSGQHSSVAEIGDALVGAGYLKVASDALPSGKVSVHVTGESKILPTTAAGMTNESALVRVLYAAKEVRFAPDAGLPAVVRHLQEVLGPGYHVVAPELKSVVAASAPVVAAEGAFALAASALPVVPLMFGVQWIDAAKGLLLSRRKKGDAPSAPPATKQPPTATKKPRSMTHPSTPEIPRPPKNLKAYARWLDEVLVPFIEPRPAGRKPTPPKQ